MRMVDSREAALQTVEESIERLEDVRTDIASIYQSCDGGSLAEFEVGESLQAVRKALTRMRKARGLLAQQKLPLRRRDEDDV